MEQSPAWTAGRGRYGRRGLGAPALIEVVVRDGIGLGGMERGCPSRDTDLGFVPLLHLAADWRMTGSAHLMFDFDGLAGGPGRAFDSSLKFGYDLNDRWQVTLGYRTLEGRADVDAVYNFAWLHYGAASVVLRL